MSAITGIVNFDQAPISFELRDQVMHALHKYPADDIQTWNSGSVFMGCCAQWITPESVHEQLPYYNCDLKLAITADAIIDNRSELFDRLQVPYYDRKRMPDSELILLAYRNWGESSPQYLIGDYAFVIWDEDKHQLFGARDLYGNRTLYYHYNRRQFAFCTAIQPLFVLDDVKKELNELWLAEFMTIPVMVESGDTNSTVYRNIHLVPPAHSFTIRDGQMSLAQYGSLAPREYLRMKTRGEYAEAFRDVMQQAVDARLRTHGQVGAALSGGLDSGTIASFAASRLRDFDKPLHAYSYVPARDFKDWMAHGRVADETPYIEETIRYVGNIRGNLLDFPGASPLSEVDDWLELLEMPYKYFENTFWIKGIFEKARQEDVKILLLGARGNQTISWGPASYYYGLLLKKLKWVELYRELKLYSSRQGINQSRLLKAIGRQAFSTAPERSLINDQADIPRMIHPEFIRRTDVFSKLQERDGQISGFLRKDAMEARSNHLQSLIIANMRGTKSTKLSLKYSVWERDPTCDPRVVRFCLSVPIEQYVGQGMDRALIRHATKGYLPDQVRLNQRVRGTQGADWIHRILPAWPAFKQELEQLCKDPDVSGVLNAGSIQATLNQLGGMPRPKDAFQPETRFLMRCVIVYRFMKSMTRSLVETY
ncbi:asparagine synthase-related protein [Paenibacillus spongiae]|uniref:asparagine synthase (glutamine-hydrolyzing) n=1 Tax=Paenibacillus spongiae TaxID=2909671 RepID=A0ABY5SCF7_9BACL|nr:asparagine synthase-related protein [Paenibacillus spongiae]UVI31622.1 asparagine synthase-related protein [Paenibacillus spongiae]